MFLKLEGVTVRYARSSGRAAVEAASLGLRQGQIGVLLGPSGCGKTSLLRAVAGLERIEAGRITMAGTVLGDAAGHVHVAPEARRIGMVFQDYALFPHLSVADNVAFGVQHLPRAERAQRVAQMLDLVGLGHAAKRAPHQLSGGQQQRIALARALAPQPQLLLLDEPFSSLDVDLRERLAQEVRAILQGSGTTALIVTHETPTTSTTGRPAASWRNSSGTGCSRRRASTTLAPRRGCTRRWATWSTCRSARCPVPFRVASATCCCAPTTSSTTTPRR